MKSIKGIKGSELIIQSSRTIASAIFEKPKQTGISKAEAKVIVESIKKTSNNIFQNIVLMKYNKAYLVLGFDTPQACLKEYKTDLSDSYVNLLLSLAEIYFKLDPKLIYLHKVSGAIFRPLLTYTDEHAAAVWKKVLETFDEKNKRIKVASIINAMASQSTLDEENKKLFQFVVDDKTLRNIQQCATKLSKDKLFANFKIAAEWQQIAALIYQQLQLECPHRDNILQTKSVKKELV
ncbi:MAG: hypothetical protein QX191_05310 [Methylococcaceae bacterium]